MIVIDEAATSPLGTVFDLPAHAGVPREVRPRCTAVHGAIGLSHDIRVSVTALRLLVDGMSDGVLDLGDPSHLARMRTHVTFLTDLLEEELGNGLGPVRVGHAPRPTDLGLMLERWSHAMREAAHAKEVEIRVCVQDELPPVACQPEQISRVILNLVDNAIRHSPRKGVVVLRAVAQGGEMEIQVDDSGPGFRASTVERVLQAERPPTGAGDGRRGLGLLIARSIVEAHGGRLWIVPRPGTASVRFSLPTGEP